MYSNNTTSFQNKKGAFFLASTSSLYHHHNKVNQYTYYFWVCAVPIKTERKDIIQRKRVYRKSSYNQYLTLNRLSASVNNQSNSCKDYRFRILK